MDPSQDPYAIEERKAIRAEGCPPKTVAEKVHDGYLHVRFEDLFDDTDPRSYRVDLAHYCRMKREYRRMKQEYFEARASFSRAKLKHDRCLARFFKARQIVLDHRARQASQGGPSP